MLTGQITKAEQRPQLIHGTPLIGLFRLADLPVTFLHALWRVHQNYRMRSSLAVFASAVFLFFDFLPARCEQIAWPWKLPYGTAIQFGMLA